jgi:hypothetical protein
VRIDRRLAEVIARAALVEPYRQISTLSTREFAQWLQKRNIDIRWQTLHHLWNLGVLHPIAVLEPAVHDQSLVGDRLVPIDLGFEVMSFVDSGVELTPDSSFGPPFELAEALAEAVIWHPFQLWWFFRLNSLLTVHLTAENTLWGQESCARSMELMISGLRERLAEFSNHDQHRSFLHLLALLLFAEPLVHTLIDTRVRTSPLLGESFEGYFDWRQAQDGAGLLHIAGLSLEEAERWHHDLAITAQLEDPIERLRVLIRHANRSKRERLEGNALLAHSLYDAAETVRRYLETYHDRELLEEDDVRYGPQGPQVKRLIYGTPRTADFDRRAVRQIVRDFDVDPQARVLWFLEGDTEEAFVRRFAEVTHLDLLRSGIDLMCLNGLGGLASDRFVALLERLRREEVFPIISVDQEQGGEHIRLLQRYTVNQLLPSGYRVWDPDFESANFTLAELAEMAKAVANQAGVEVELTEQSIRDQMHERSQPAGTAIERLWGRATFPGGKGRAWGIALAEWAAEHRGPAEVTVERGLRPVQAALSFLLQGQLSNYRFTVQRMVVGDGGTVLPSES